MVIGQCKIQNSLHRLKGHADTRKMQFRRMNVMPYIKALKKKSIVQVQGGEAMALPQFEEIAEFLIEHKRGLAERTPD